jgi:hypothetical protein
MSAIVCDEFNRILTVDGEPKPHITDVLKDLGLSKSFEGVDTWFADRGKAVHQACKLINEGTLDEETVASECRAFVRAYKQWLKDSGFTHQHSELALFSALHDYCGTLDLIGTLPQTGRVVVDIKTGSSIDPAVEIQVGAQAILWEENNPQEPISGRYVLQLKGDGTYRLKDLTDVPPYLFLDALKIWRWKMGHKRKPKQEVAAAIQP